MTAAAPLPAALILAGSRHGAQDPVALAEGVAHKALAQVDGVPLLARVHAALREAGVARIAVVADAPEVIALAQSLGAELVPPESGPSGSVACGFALLGAPMLVTTPGEIAEVAVARAVGATPAAVMATSGGDVYPVPGLVTVTLTMPPVFGSTVAVASAPVPPPLLSVTIASASTCGLLAQFG